MAHAVKVPQSFGNVASRYIRDGPKRTKPVFDTLCAIACITLVPLAFRRPEGFQKTIKAGIATKSRQDVIKA